MIFNGVNSASGSSVSANPRGSLVLDVDGVVNALVQSKMAPLNRVTAEIEKRDIALSAAGVFRSKVADFESALSSLEGRTFETFSDLKDKLSSFVSAYNSLQSYYKASVKGISGASSSSADVNTLSGSPSISSFMDRISRFLSSGLFEAGSESGGYVLTLRSLGVSLQLDGSMKLGSPPQLLNNDEEELSLTETESRLLTRFNNANGVTVGYDVTRGTLRDFLADDVPLVLEKLVTEKSNQTGDLLRRQNLLQNRIDLIRESYYKQYSALDAQLARLQSLSSSLSGLFANLANVYR